MPLDGNTSTSTESPNDEVRIIKTHAIKPQKHPCRQSIGLNFFRANFLRMTLPLFV